MSEIPEDIKAKAWSLLLELNFHEGPSHQKLDMIEAVILAEREACAKIAEDAANSYIAQNTDALKASLDVALKIRRR